MPKTRLPIPKNLRDRILAEFNHRCAICGASRPQLHHIDEDPGNNVPENLVPLCPNCHLIDQHNPTAPVDPLKLRIFRLHKDPLILGPQFHPLFRRFSYLFRVERDFDYESAREAGVELIAFVNALKMGGFYHVRIADLLELPNPGLFDEVLGQPDDVWETRSRARDKKSIARLQKNRDRVVELIVEMLRYQDWPLPQHSHLRDRNSSERTAT